MKILIQIALIVLGISALNIAWDASQASHHSTNTHYQRTWTGDYEPVGEWVAAPGPDKGKSVGFVMLAMFLFWLTYKLEPTQSSDDNT